MKQSFVNERLSMEAISTCCQNIVTYAHENVAYLNVTHKKIAYDEGNGWISSYTETGQLYRN